MSALRIILTLLALTAHAHARDDGTVAPQPNSVPTLAPAAA